MPAHATIVRARKRVRARRRPDSSTNTDVRASEGGGLVVGNDISLSFGRADGSRKRLSPNRARSGVSAWFDRRSSHHEIALHVECMFDRAKSLQKERGEMTVHRHRSRIFEARTAGEVRS